MIKVCQDFLERFIEAFAGAVIVAFVFGFIQMLLAHHKLHQPLSLLVSLVVYASIYGLLFAVLHVGGRPNWRSTTFTAFVWVILSCLWVYADEKFAGLTVWTAIVQFLFAAMLSVSTYVYVYINRTPPASARS